MRWLVVAGAIDAEDRDRLVEALELIRAETSYENWEDDARRADVGLIRGAAVKLAATLKDAGVGAPSIDSWMAEAAIDPMPEVRYVTMDYNDDP